MATDTKFTPGAATRLALVADDASIKADGADMTRVVVKALDSQQPGGTHQQRRGDVHRHRARARSWAKAR